MRIKYSIERDNKNKKLLLREYAEIDKDTYALMNEETYDKKVLSDAAGKGLKSLMEALRTPNMYPPAVFAEKITAGVLAALASRKSPLSEIHMDDLELVDKKQPVRRKSVPAEEETDDFDDMVDDLIEDCDDETCTIKNEDTESDLVEAFPFDEVV